MESGRDQFGWMMAQEASVALTPKTASRRERISGSVRWYCGVIFFGFLPRCCYEVKSQTLFGVLDCPTILFRRQSGKEGVQRSLASSVSRLLMTRSIRLLFSRSRCAIGLRVGAAGTFSAGSGAQVTDGRQTGSSLCVISSRRSSSRLICLESSSNPVLRSGVGAGCGSRRADWL